MSNKNMSNREVCDLIFVDYATKKPFLNLDFANVTTTELDGLNLRFDCDCAASFTGKLDALWVSLAAAGKDRFTCQLCCGDVCEVQI